MYVVPVGDASDSRVVIVLFLESVSRMHILIGCASNSYWILYRMFFRRLFSVTNFMWFIDGWWRCHRSVDAMQTMSCDCNFAATRAEFNNFYFSWTKSIFDNKQFFENNNQNVKDQSILFRRTIICWISKFDRNEWHWTHSSFVRSQLMAHINGDSGFLDFCISTRHLPLI